MKARTTALTLAAMCFLGAAVAFAQSPFMGTWKLNEAKSKLGPGAPKNTTVVYEAAGDNIKVTVEGTNSAGNPTHTEWTGKMDGREYAVTGSPTSDMRSYRMIGTHTLSFTETKGGKVVTSGRIAVSADGKTRTVTATETDSKGKKIHMTSFYDKG
ncbi:MAG: hypothetical protein KGL59_07275 [Acidobacteriota bacterium]|nr:hypothetical protein [Acidobacteriota bacterium]